YQRMPIGCLVDLRRKVISTTSGSPQVPVVPMLTSIVEPPEHPFKSLKYTAALGEVHQLPRMAAAPAGSPAGVGAVMSPMLELPATLRTVPQLQLVLGGGGGGAGSGGTGPIVTTPPGSGPAGSHSS